MQLLKVVSSQALKAKCAQDQPHTLMQSRVPAQPHLPVTAHRRAIMGSRLGQHSDVVHVESELLGKLLAKSPPRGHVQPGSRSKQNPLLARTKKTALKQAQDPPLPDSFNLFSDSLSVKAQVRSSEPQVKPAPAIQSFVHGLKQKQSQV